VFELVDEPAEDELEVAISRLEVLAFEDLPDVQAEERYASMRRAKERLESLDLRWLAQLEKRRTFERDGHLSATSWLAATQDVSWGEAKRQVETAKALQEMPIVFSALDDGSVSLSAARMLVRARDVDPDAFARAEALLVDAASQDSLPVLQRTLARWRYKTTVGTGGSADDQLFERRSLNAGVVWGGVVRLEGDLDPETGEMFLTAIGAVMDAETRARTEEDVRTPAQRRCDALAEVSRRFLDRLDRPSVAGERPHVVLTVDAGALAGVGKSPSDPLVDLHRPEAELDRTGPTGIDAALRISCDSSVMRMVLSADSQPLDVGRRTPVVPPSLRRAVIARDRTCRFPGCDRPQTWCDAHHVRHWARGGDTALSNLVLLCRRHHRLVHTGRFGLEMVDGRPIFTRPDGSRLDLRAPP
jgi:hypothetical protein